MPIYEYICSDCSEKCELLLLSSEDAAVCPKCGSRRLNRVMSTFSAASSGKSASADYGQCDFGGTCGTGGGCGCPVAGCKH